MICPSCGTDNPPDARFCIQCGVPLPRVCPRCGTANPVEARFCMHCGAPLVEETAPAPSVEAGEGIGPSGEDHPVTVGPERTRTTGRGRSGRGRKRTRADGAPPAGVPAPAPAPTLATQDPSAAPARVRLDAVSSLEPEGSAAERRIVTVLFADLTSSTQMAAALDPEDMRDLLAEYFARMTRELHLHGGTVEKYIGDAVMAVFGLPIAHEDDPVRAVRAALGMRAALGAFNDERHAGDDLASGALHMRIGINTGEVVAASGSDAAEGHDFLITGDVVNVAARLQQEAGPDAILVGPRTYRATRGAVLYRPVPAVTVRGKALPIHAWEALEMAVEGVVPAPRPRGIEGLRAPLIGRDVEMDLLGMLYMRAVRERHPHRVTVLGTPGTGKTRLAREFANSLLGVSSVAGPDVPPVAGPARTAPDGARPQILEGRCPPYGAGITYWPLVEMLRTYCDISALDEPEAARARLRRCVADALAAAGRQEDPELVAAYLGHTIGIEPAERAPSVLPSDAQQLQDGRFRAWRIFFEALAQVRPLVVFIDDIHWGDDALLDLVEYLVARVKSVPLLILCVARPELLERRPTWGHGQRNDISIELEPLTSEDAARFLGALLPAAHIPQSLRRGILAQAEGNPFYIEEIVRMLVDRGILVRAPVGEPAREPGQDDAPDGVWRVAPAWEESAEVRDPVIPDTVQGVVAARLDLLPADERQVLQHAAVIGRYFWASALQELAPERSRATLEQLLDALTQRGLIRESERASDLETSGERAYTFNNVLVREVAYATIPRARRAQEHARLAARLEALAEGRDGRLVELLAEHYQQYYLQANLARSRSVARRLAVRTKAVEYLTRAGDAAAARHAAPTAVQFYSDALALLEEPPRPTALAAARAPTTSSGAAEARTDGETITAPEDGEPSTATSSWRDSIPQRVDLLTRRGDAYWMKASGDAAWADYREALGLWLEFGRDRQPEEWARRGLRLYTLLVMLPTRYGSWFRDPPSHEELGEYLDQGIQLAERLGQRQTLEGAALLTAKSFFWWSWPDRRGEKELLDALRSAREAVQITESLGDARGASQALDALGNIQATTSDLRGNLESHRRRLFWAQQIEDFGELVDIQAEVSTAYEQIGDYAPAVEHAHAALRLAESADNDLMRVQALEREVLAYFEWDRWLDAVQACERLAVLVANTTVPAQTTVGATQRFRVALLARAIAETRLGRDADAEHTIRLVREAPETHEGQMVSLYRARLALARGMPDEAERVLLAAMALRANRSRMADVLADLAELAARRPDRAAYDRYGSQALELGWRSGARKALARAIRARGIMATADRRWDDGEADLHNALNRFIELGTRWEEATTRLALVALARGRAGPGDDRMADAELKRSAELLEEVRAARDLAETRALLAGGEVSRR